MRVLEPTLASTIYSTLLQTSGTTTRQAIISQRDNKRRVLSGCAGIDEVLGSGLAYGRGGLCCISGDEGSGVDELAQNLLITHLLSHTSTTATIIDSRGAFDVRKLHRGLISRIEASSGVPDGEDAPKSNSSELAGRILGRVEIMRVFDVDGLFEGVAEMKEELEGVLEGRTVGEKGQEERVSGIRSTIADSQGDEEEMLDDLAPGDVSIDAASRGEHEGQGGLDLESEERCHMLVIDNLSQVMSPMIKSDYVQGHALVTTFLRSLAHTARQHNVCVLLLNSALTYKEQQDGPSAFSSIVGRPGLGKTLNYMVDTHLFVNRLPRTQRDMKIAYAEGDERRGISSGDRGRIQWVNVVEVLQDREDGRVGGVGLFTIDDSGCVTKAF
ncbi:hypothetical protein BDV97DRAFT_350711 [Delphinella strobiligena]|nr:hypothetical protein BDV97DRAFT_350711 [Delphinella strobiligena]